MQFSIVETSPVERTHDATRIHVKHKSQERQHTRVQTSRDAHHTSSVHRHGHWSAERLLYTNRGGRRSALCAMLAVRVHNEIACKPQAQSRAECLSAARPDSSAARDMWL